MLRKTNRGNRKTWGCINDVVSNTDSIIDVMATVQKMVVEYRTFIAKSVFTRILAGLKQIKHIDATFDVYLDCLTENAEKYKRRSFTTEVAELNIWSKRRSWHALGLHITHTCNSGILIVFACMCVCVCACVCSLCVYVHSLWSLHLSGSVGTPVNRSMLLCWRS